MLIAENYKPTFCHSFVILILDAQKLFFSHLYLFHIYTFYVSFLTHTLIMQQENLVNLIIHILIWFDLSCGNIAFLHLQTLYMSPVE